MQEYLVDCLKIDHLWLSACETTACVNSDKQPIFTDYSLYRSNGQYWNITNAMCYLSLTMSNGNFVE